MMFSVDECVWMTPIYSHDERLQLSASMVNTFQPTTSCSVGGHNFDDSGHRYILVWALCIAADCDCDGDIWMPWILRSSTLCVDR